MKIGTKVRSLRDFHMVPKGTIGYVVEDYGTGLTIAWDLPDRPYPRRKTTGEVAAMYAVNPECPLRDGFDKQTELDLLEMADGSP